MEVLTDVNLEYGILGTIIEKPSTYHKVAPFIVNEKVFTDNRSQTLWKKLGKMVEKNDVIDLTTICSSLTGDEMLCGLSYSFIVEIVQRAGTSGLITTYTKQLYEKYLLRKVIEDSKGIQDSAEKNDGLAYDKIVGAHTTLGELIELKPSKEFDISEELTETIESVTSKEEKLIKTGYGGIDKFSGGFTRGEISIIGGRPGHGKTTTMLNILAKMVNLGKKVICFNRELPNYEMLKKLLCIESQNLSYSMVRKGIYDETGLQELERVQQIIKEKYHKGLFVMHDDIKDFSGAATEIKKFQPDVVFDDYIQLINPSNPTDPRRLQLERLVNDYKWVAKTHKCSVVLVSQLNRALETRGDLRPQLSDLAESGAIEQVAENVLFSYYDYKINGDKSKKGKFCIQVIARKVRYGETGECDLVYDGDKATLYNDQEEFESSAETSSDIPF